MRKIIVKQGPAFFLTLALSVCFAWVQPAYAAETSQTYTVTANLYVPGDLNTQLPGVTAYLTNGNNPLGLGGYKAVAPTTPVSDNAVLTVASDGAITLNLNIPNPVFTLQKIGGCSNADITDSVWDSETYATIDGSVSRDGRITKVTVELKDRSGTYVFTDCTEFPTLLGMDWTVPLTLSVDLSGVTDAGAGASDSNTHHFADVPDSAWYAEAVLYVRKHGLMMGTSEVTFSGDGETTRGMLAMILYRHAGSPDVTATSSEWYSTGQAWSVAKGISDGSDMTGEISREQLVTMLWRYAGSKAESGDRLSVFNDGAQVSSFAVEAMNWAVEKGIIGGTGDGRLNPAGNTTRAEMAAMLMRFCKLQEGQTQ